MISFDAAIGLIGSTLQAGTSAPERISVPDAAGRYLSHDAVARMDVPAFDRSAVDGYAVLPDDPGPVYQILTTIKPGSPGTMRLEKGMTVKIMTGAVVPEGVGRIQMVEHTAIGPDGRVQFLKSSSASNICRRGEDRKSGQTVLPAGTRLDPESLAALTMCGIREVDVIRKPRVAVLSTGDEIIASMEDWAPGKVMNLNGPMLAALCERHGGAVSVQALAGDTRQRLATLLRDALGQSDLVLFSGGVSAGDFDFIPDTVREAGLSIHFTKVAVKPGKPVLFATGAGGIVVGLPGNPVSAYLDFHLFVLPVMARLMGLPAVPVRELSAPLARTFQRRAAERREYVPCRLTRAGLAEQLDYNGSGHFAALWQADGFFVVEAGRAMIEAGSPVPVLLTRLVRP